MLYLFGPTMLNVPKDCPFRPWDKARWKDLIVEIRKIHNDEAYIFFPRRLYAYSKWVPLTELSEVEKPS